MSTNSSKSQRKWDRSNENTFGGGYLTTSIEKIKQGYNEPYCQFYQFFNPASRKYLEVDPENSAVGLTEDVLSFNSKLWILVVLHFYSLQYLKESDLYDIHF